MIIDPTRFAQVERPYWVELEQHLKELESKSKDRWTVENARRFHYLYERTSSDLQRLTTFAPDKELAQYLESLVSRAYSEIHETRRRSRFDFWHWISTTVPRTFRRHRNAFYLSLVLTIISAILGGLAVVVDDEAKDALLPEMFANHRGDPRSRVTAEEKETSVRSKTASSMTAFSAFLIQNNIKVAINCMALGLTYGIGTGIMLLHNGLILGVVGLDYILSGQTIFLLGWLLPHGVIEIPAILIAGQAGFVIAKALIGWGRRERLRERMRLVGADLVTLIGCVVLMLIWAGIVEAFFSQFHEPRVPYGIKIAFGMFEFAMLFAYLLFGGRERTAEAANPSP